MDKLIKGDKSRRVFAFLLLLFLNGACKSIIDTTSKSFDIKFSSLYDEDKCTLTINGKKYYKDEYIITDRSLGIDLSKRISIKEDIININVFFEALIDDELDIQRTVKLDTTLYIKDGFNIIIFADSDQIKIQQQSKVYELE